MRGPGRGIPIGRKHFSAEWIIAKLQRILTDVAYTGQVAHNGDVLPGEHPGIVSKATFRRIQVLIGQNGNGNGKEIRNKHGALLKGILRCGSCGAAMAHTYSKKGNRLYRYYVCTTVQKQGRDACNTPSLPTQETEEFVVEQMKKIGRDPQPDSARFCTISSDGSPKPRLADPPRDRFRPQTTLAGRTNPPPNWKPSRPGC